MSIPAKFARRLGGFTLALVALVLFGVFLLELAAIVWVAGEIGWWTLALLLATSVCGIVLMQREWRKTWGRLVEALSAGQMPTGRLADATLVLAGGLLLVAPGFITDALGLILLLPFTRSFVRSAIGWCATRYLARNPAAPSVIKGEATEARNTHWPDSAIEPGERQP